MYQLKFAENITLKDFKYIHAFHRAWNPWKEPDENFLYLMIMKLLGLTIVISAGVNVPESLFTKVELPTVGPPIIIVTSSK